MDDLAERQMAAARTQSLFRDVNERIAKFPGATLEILCECANDHCFEPVAVSRDDYDSVRAWPDRFLTKRQHQVPAFENEVSAMRNVVIVAKFGAGSAVAAELAPTRAQRRNESRQARAAVRYAAEAGA